jgi:hypothetical protein
MDAAHAIEAIKEKFAQADKPAAIPLLKKRGGRDHFAATLSRGGDGIDVDNLRKNPFLPWVVFEEAIGVMISNKGRAMRGDTMRWKLGDAKLPLNSIEGHIAHVIYRQQIGETVFRRITPIACILIWAGVCKGARGELVLR